MRYTGELHLRQEASSRDRRPVAPGKEDTTEMEGPCHLTKRLNFDCAMSAKK